MMGCWAVKTCLLNRAAGVTAVQDTQLPQHDSSKQGLLGQVARLVLVVSILMGCVNLVVTVVWPMDQGCCDYRVEPGAGES